jgi:hypothetical protein
MAYRILTLDGGGVWALLQVMALQQLYKDDTQGYDVLKDFNLVAANCGGSITLAGLIMNKRLSKILADFYSSEAENDSSPLENGTAYGVSIPRKRNFRQYNACLVTGRNARCQHYPVGYKPRTLGLAPISWFAPVIAIERGRNFSALTAQAKRRV